MNTPSHGHTNTKRLQPVIPLDHVLLDKMCKQAAVGVHLQCAREYWEEEEECEVRATQLHKLTPEVRECVPTGNLKCEHYLSRFGGLASVSAAKSNRFYKAKRIRDDLMFDTKMSNDEAKVNKSTRNVIEELSRWRINGRHSKKNA